MILAIFLMFTSLVSAAPSWYGATSHVSRYEDDPRSNYSYQFGNFKTYSEYTDPDLSETANLENPLDNTKYGNYDLIIVVNKEDNQTWGRAQTLRVYERGIGLRY